MLALARLFLAVALLAVANLPQAARARDATPSPEVAWRLLDYIAVDYPGAVSKGRIISEAEYAEMREFSASVRSRIGGLPASSAKPQLLTEANALIASVDQRAEPADVARQARTLATDLLKAYPVPLAPQQAPDLARGRPSMPSSARLVTAPAVSVTVRTPKGWSRRRSPSPTWRAPGNAASLVSTR